MFKKALIASIAAALMLPMAASAGVNLNISGSTALLPLVKASAESYQGKHSDVKISVSGGGSYTGLAQVHDRAVDIGDSDVIAGGSMGLKDHKVAVVGFAIIVNPDAGVSNLSSKQIRDIFAGRVSNWKQVGGKDQAIVVINRPTTSGTRAVFNATIMGASKIAGGGQVVDSSGQVVTNVATVPGTVSYVAMGYAKGKPVTMVKINGVQLTEDNIRRGKYPIWSYEHMFTRPGAPREAEDFIDYVASNKDDIEKLGFILLSSMKVKENNR